MPLVVSRGLHLPSRPRSFLPVGDDGKNIYLFPETLADGGVTFTSNSGPRPVTALPRVVFDLRVVEELHCPRTGPTSDSLYRGGLLLSPETLLGVRGRRARVSSDEPLGGPYHLTTDISNSFSSPGVLKLEIGSTRNSFFRPPSINPCLVWSSLCRRYPRKTFIFHTELLVRSVYFLLSFIS